MRKPTPAQRDVVRRFYADVVNALGQWMQTPTATPQGAATVVKRVAIAWQLPDLHLVAMPRLTRKQIEQLPHALRARGSTTNSSGLAWSAVDSLDAQVQRLAQQHPEWLTDAP